MLNGGLEPPGLRLWWLCHHFVDVKPIHTTHFKKSALTITLLAFLSFTVKQFKVSPLVMSKSIVIVKL